MRTQSTASFAPAASRAAAAMGRARQRSSRVLSRLALVPLSPRKPRPPTGDVRSAAAAVRDARRERAHDDAGETPRRHDAGDLDNALAAVFDAPGPVVVVFKVRAEKVDFVTPARDGVHLKNRFRLALLGADGVS